jgi:hypothetical protein
MEAQEYKFNHLQEALKKYGEELISLYRQKLSSYNIDATGKLGNTLNFIIKENDDLYELSLDIQDYWIYVEEGRRPGKFPPIDNIRE